MPRTSRHDRDDASFRTSIADAGGPPAYSFHVRLWRETGSEALWRGTISDLHGRRYASFSSVARLAEILSDPAGVLVLLRPDDRPGDAAKPD
jgi:hypothetical protein